MNRMFGTKREKQPPPSLNECAANIDGRADAIEQKVEKLNASITKLSDQMRKMRDGQQSKNLLRQRIINLLRQRKQYEQQLDMLRQQSFNIEQQRMTIESVKDNQMAIKAMKSGVTEMKREMKHVNMRELDKLQDDLEDYMYQNDELQEALGRTYQVPDFDENELEAELEALSADFDYASKDTANYLDELNNAPIIPNKEPISERNNIETDEFGLPIMPNKM